MLRFVKRSLFVSASFGLAAVTAPAFGRPPAPLRPLPTVDGAATTGDPRAVTPSSLTPAATPSPQQVYEHIRRGVVALERNGVPVALGMVLDGDGRVLTSLSGLSGAEGADVRYADATSVHAKVARVDSATDLALLVPESGKWTDGLSASESDPVGAVLHAMLPARGARLVPADAGVKGRVEARARDGEPMASMLDVDLKGPAVAGAPLLDATGSVVAVLVRACKGAAPASPAAAMGWAAWAANQDPAAKASAVPCTPVIVGAPVAAIRSFLTKASAAPAATAPFLGIRGEAVQAGGVRGVRVTAVAPSSPAQEAGLRPNADVIVAADGRAIDAPEKLADALTRHVAGDTIKLLVFGDEKFREVPVDLRPPP